MIKYTDNFVEAYYHYENNLSMYSNSTIDSDDQIERKRMNSSPTLASLNKQSSAYYYQHADSQAKQGSFTTNSTNPSIFNTNITNNSNMISFNNNNNKLEEDGQQSPDANINGKKQTDTNKYKTELCNTFNLTGHCDYGSKCRFAHGKDELQKKPSVSNNLFRTKLCKAFHEKMYCPYGQRCHFLHEIRTVIQIQGKKTYQKKLLLESQFLTKGNLTNNTTNPKQSSRLPIFNYICSSNNVFQSSTSK